MGVGVIYLVVIAKYVMTQIGLCSCFWHVPVEMVVFRHKILLWGSVPQGLRHRCKSTSLLHRVESVCYIKFNIPHSRIWILHCTGWCTTFSFCYYTMPDQYTNNVEIAPCGSCTSWNQCFHYGLEERPFFLLCRTLLHKVISCNQSHIGVHEHHLMFKGPGVPCNWITVYYAMVMFEFA